MTQLIPAAVVTGDNDQANHLCTCLVLSHMSSHFYVPEYICWQRDAHCGYLNIFRLERTPVIQDHQFCRDRLAHLIQSAELSTRMWFQWVCGHTASLQRSSPWLSVSCQCALLGFSFGWGGWKLSVVMIASVRRHFPVVQLQPAGIIIPKVSVQNQITDVKLLPSSLTYSARWQQELKPSCVLIGLCVFPVIFVQLLSIYFGRIPESVNQLGISH